MSDDEVATRTVEPAQLDDVQYARVAALRVARALLTPQGQPSGGVIDLVDLITLAQWIADGKDPWPKGEANDQGTTTR